MRKSLPISVTVVVLASYPIAFGQSQPGTQLAPEAKDVTAAELQQLRESAETPEEKVAITDKWLKSHPPAASELQASKATFQARMSALNALTVPPKPTDERGSLAWEVRKVLNETLARARTPEEAVALTEEFRQLNAEALRELAPKAPTQEERKVAAARRPARSRNLQDEIAEVLRETRAEARTPEETVALTAEFLRLNAAAIAEAYPETQKNKSPQ